MCSINGFEYPYHVSHNQKRTKPFFSKSSVFIYFFVAKMEFILFLLKYIISYAPFTCMKLFCEKKKSLTHINGFSFASPVNTFLFKKKIFKLG